MKRPFKVLLIYPGFFMQLGLPLGIAYLASALKKDGFEVKIFDTIFYREPGDVDINEERQKAHHSVKPVDYNSVGISKKDTDMLEDFSGVLNDYQPDLIGISAVEGIFERGLKLSRQAKKISPAPVIFGGVFPTMAPEAAIAEDSVDMICIGEGEEALLELCRRLRDERDYSDIKSLWVKIGGEVIKNGLYPLKDFKELAEPDFSGFEQSVFYRPMQGRLWRTLPVETARGCPYLCSYCCAPALKRLYKAECGQSYFRNRPISSVLAEIENEVKKYSPEFIYFTSETFLAMNDKEFAGFISGYGRIKLPFWIQTRVETIADDRIKKLREVGLYWMSIGIEHGNEEFRRKYLKRYSTNEQILDAFKVLDRCRQGASVNSIIGLPFETRELLEDTIGLNRKILAVNKRIRCSISVFTPFRGCELHEVCLKHNLIDDVPYTSHTNLIGGSILKSPYFSKEDLNGILRTFSFRVHFPAEYRQRIQLAEKFTPEGNREFELLSREAGRYVC